MINHLFILAVSLALVIRGATLATTYAGKLAETYHLSRYTVGFIVIAIISILPETLISVTAAVEGVPEFGLGMLFGSNVADLTLIFALIVFLSGRGLKIESSILKNQKILPFLMLLPLVLGFDGHFTRGDGISLILTGIAFYYVALKNGRVHRATLPLVAPSVRHTYVLWLILSMTILLLGAHFVVSSATALAGYWGVSPVLIGILIVGLGTTMPEFLFSLHSVRRRDDSLAVGDILGTVLADCTIVVGILALINPFTFPVKIIYSTGVFMIAAVGLLFHYMRSGRTLSRREAFMLFIFWIFFVLVEYSINLPSPAPVTP